MRSLHTFPCREKGYMLQCFMLPSPEASSLSHQGEHLSQGITFSLTPFHWATELTKISKSILQDTIGISSGVVSCNWLFPSPVFCRCQSAGSWEVDIQISGVDTQPSHTMEIGLQVDEAVSHSRSFSLGPYSYCKHNLLPYTATLSIFSEVGKWLTPYARTTTFIQFL